MNSFAFRSLAAVDFRRVGRIVGSLAAAAFVWGFLALNWESWSSGFRSQLLERDEPAYFLSFPANSSVSGEVYAELRRHKIGFFTWTGVGEDVYLTKSRDLSKANSLLSDLHLKGHRDFDIKDVEARQASARAAQASAAVK